ncbi:MAG: peroxide stress protein YaaA [Mariprofundales bacterium]
MIISPAKKLNFDALAPCSAHTAPACLTQARQLIALLREKDSFEIAELMNLSMNLADLNVARYQAWQPDLCGKQALWAFRGDVYRSMDADSLDGDDIQFAQAHLRILSGLYGLLRPLDIIHPHRLEMGTRLTNPHGANLYAFWGDRITQLLNDDFEAGESNILINLASNEYFRSIKAHAVDGAIVTPVFKEHKGGDCRVIAIYAKRARGLMARYIINNRLQNPDDLRAFDCDGYRWSAVHSDGDQMVFTR